MRQGYMLIEVVRDMCKPGRMCLHVAGGDGRCREGGGEQGTLPALLFTTVVGGCCDSPPLPPHGW